MRYRLIEASSADEAWLDNLRRQAYAELFDATWGGWDEARHSRHFTASLERGNISIIELDGDRVGMVQLFEDGDGVELAEIQIDPRHQSRGIATRVLLDVISQASAHGLAVRLRVGVKNERAVRLYERLGFNSVEQSDTHFHMLREPVR